MTSFKYGALRTVGALTIRANGLGTSSFHPTILSTGLNFKHNMPSLIARASSSFALELRRTSPPPWWETGRRKQRYYYSRSPSLTPTSSKDISPRSRPTKSMVASGFSRLRSAPAVFRPPQFFGRRHFFLFLLTFIWNWIGLMLLQLHMPPRKNFNKRSNNRKKK